MNVIQIGDQTVNPQPGGATQGDSMVDVHRGNDQVVPPTVAAQQMSDHPVVDQQLVESTTAVLTEPLFATAALPSSAIFDQQTYPFSEAYPTVNFTPN